MAYTTKYKVPFTTPLGNSGTVYFKKDGYLGPEVTLGTRNVGIIFNYEYGGMWEPIIGSNVQLSLHNSSPTLSGYDDIFESEERDFQVAIDITNDVETINLFTGYLNAGIHEQTYMLNSTINISANNYLSQIENTHDDSIDTIQRLSTIDILNKSLRLTGKEDDIYVNHTLCPSAAYVSTTNKTAFNMTAIDTEAFWEDNVVRKGGKSSIDMILGPLDSWIYPFDGNWYVERWADIWNENKVFYKYNSGSSYNAASTCSYIEVDCSSTSITSLSRTGLSEKKSHILGAKTIRCENKPRRFLNHVTNNFDDYDVWITNAGAPIPSKRRWITFETTYAIINKYGSDVPVEWYYEPVSNYKGITNGMAFGIENGDDYYMNFDFHGEDSECGELRARGLNYRFEVTVGDSSTSATSMNIDWKMLPYEFTKSTKYLSNFSSYYYLKEYGNSKYIYFVEDEEDSNNSYWEYGDSNPDDAIQTATVVRDRTYNSEVLEFSANIPLADVSGLTTGDKDFILCFGMSTYQYYDTNLSGNPNVWNDVMMDKSVIGDVVVTTDGADSPNLLTVTIDDLKTFNKEEITQDIFDAPSLNYINGFYTGYGFNDRTEYWLEKGGTKAYDLAKWRLESKTQFYRKNRKTLSMDIISTDFYRPLSLWYDPEDSRIYILTSYSYRPLEDSYTMDFLEYDNMEQINFTEA